MIEITLLGRVSVSAAGQPVTGEAVQRRRIALIALLCDTGMRGVARDRLMACLWPDNDTESARHLLSVSLHVLRKALGADAITVTGEQVQLDPLHVRVDAIEFEKVARSGEHERAVELYTGPFAEGLFISGSSEFEHWLDARRVELSRLYAQALQASAEARASRGEHEGAVSAWRRLAALDPYSARTTLGLMRALSASGNRAGALQAARVHAQLLEAEFGAAPEPEVTRFAEVLRQERSGDSEANGTARAPPDPAAAKPEQSQPAESPSIPEAVAVRPAMHAVSESVARATGAAAATGSAKTNGEVPRSGGLAALRHVGAWYWGAIAIVAAIAIATITIDPRDPAPRVVAVIPLSGNASDQADASFSAGIAEGIHTQLRAAGQLRVINSASSFLFRDSTLDARRIGKLLGADALVYVRVTAAGPMLRVTVELVRTSDGVVEWDATKTVPHGNLFAIADSLAPPIGAALRVHLAPRGALALSGGTRDDAALKLFWRGRERWRARTPESLREALVLFRSAIEQDSSYAWAYVGLADTYTMLGSFEYGVLPPDSARNAARAAADRALRLVPDFPPALAARANVLMIFDWQWEEAEREFRRALALDRSYAEARAWLAMLLLARGRSDDAHALLNQALIDNGNSALLSVDLAQYHYFRTEFDSAYHYLDRALELDPSFSRAHVLQALVLCVDQRTGEAITVAERLARHAGDDPLVAGLLGYLYARAQRRDEAMEQLRLVEGRRRGGYVPLESLAMIHLGLDDYTRALDLLEQAAAERSTGMLYLTLDPILEPLRTDARLQPRFSQLVRTVHGE